MNIYIGNLSLETTEDELRRQFAGFGEVVSVIIMNDEYIGSGQPRGYGYVQMTSKADGIAAIAGLTGKIMDATYGSTMHSLGCKRNRRC